MLFSYYHISEETLPLYLERLAEFRPASLEGFPSTLLILAQALNRRRATIPIRAVFSSSEPLYGVHRSQIEQAFETKVFDLYGQAERVVCATECGMHTGLHVNPEYGILEVLAGDRKAGPGESGQIVGTGLNNYGMPLLRYMTGDTARVSPTLCPCGRAMPLLDTVEGRVADTIVTPDGRRIPGDGIMCAFHGIGNIARSQVVQEGPDTLVVYIVPDGAPATVDTARLIRALKECVGPEMKIESRLVTSLDKSPGGKFRWVVSHCGVKNGSQLLVTGNEPSQRE
jgi:phenylacetate-CoA ligase